MAQPLTYLLDTNVWLERLLDQDRAGEVKQILDVVPSSRLLITDFSFHSIGVILVRLGLPETLLGFTGDLFDRGSVRLLTLGPMDMERIVAVASEYGLDFDDAYQYVAADANNVPLVSFDSDFDKTERGRITPLQIMTERETKE
ncbi:type II toxin-antitoxin system VapC family toxin [soil metagenome]